MISLVIAISFSVIVRAALMGTGLCKLRNHWISNLALFPSFLLMAWVIAGLRPKSRMGTLIVIAMLPIAAIASWEASRTGLNSVWNHAATLVALTLLAACLWEIFQLFRLDTSGPLWSIPAFWLIAAWTLDNSTSLIFHTLFDYFILHMKHPWILIPWLVVFILGAIFNFILAKAFLCPKPQSS